MSDHSPEPWKITLDCDIEDADENTVILGLRAVDCIVLSNESAKEADIRRIIACVNACKGFSTEELEKLLSHGGILAHFITVPPEVAKIIRNSPDDGIVRLEDDHEPS